jgi:alpha,alpha-trehalose phosphorylase (configuration-retaining)
VYLIDFSVQTIEFDDSLAKGEDLIADHVIGELEKYEHDNLAKFIGAGIPYDLMKKSPKLCSRLWLELDIVPISIMPDSERYELELKDNSYWDVKCVDEQADSMARKCIMCVWPWMLHDSSNYLER